MKHCENARFELHDGGHYTPSKASWRNFMKLALSCDLNMSTVTDKNTAPTSILSLPGVAKATCRLSTLMVRTDLMPHL